MSRVTRQEAETLVKQTLNQAYDETGFRQLISSLCPDAEILSEPVKTLIPEAFQGGVMQFKRLAKYQDPELSQVDILAVKLAGKRTLENARTLQRNFVARYLNGSRGGQLKDAALVAFYADECPDWRFSLVRMDYELDSEKQKVKKTLTPARRFSFLVGEGEQTHTPCKQLLPIIQSPTSTTLKEIEAAFNIEKVTKEFFEEYKKLYLRLKEALDKHLETDATTKDEFTSKSIKTEDFAKRLLGQLVFLYFLQKKGWLGVAKGAAWGTGSKNYLRELFDIEATQPNRNFFNDVLEHLFYDALATERQTQDHFFPALNCKIPFLNGGLFEPFKGYAWDATDILLDNAIFKAIFDVFDLYNFTVREDEPLDKEVAVDPEMLGKVFENLIPENERKGSGTYYTPREIVHYMCQESLINYLDAKLNIQSQPKQKEGQKLLFAELTKVDLLTEYEDVYVERVPKADLADFIHLGDTVQEHDATATLKAQQADYKGKYQPKIPESVRLNAQAIDDALASVKVCDPAIGSGAFPVGIMTELVRARLALNAYLGEDKRSAYDFKRHAIQESIYGVDIEPSAVDIAKLRLWLSLVVDETDFGTIKPLPNLDYKIMAGNSLLGVEKNLFNYQALDKLEKLKVLQFDETRPSHKEKLKQDIEAIRSQLLNNEVSFDYEIDFSNIYRLKGGFDLVIGNPPYVQIKKNTYSSNRFPYSEGKDQGKQNLYKMFVELSSNLLKTNGTSCLIVQSSLLCDLSSQYTRELLLTTSSLEKIIEFPKNSVDRQAQVFENVLQGTCITLFIKKIPYDDQRFVISVGNNVNTIKKLEFECLYQRKLMNYYPGGFFIPLVKKGDFAVIDTINRKGKFLREFATSISQGDINLTTDSDVFSTKKETETPLIRGKHIARYRINYSTEENVVKNRELFKIDFNSKNIYLICQEITGTTDKRRLHFSINELGKEFLCGHTVNKILLKNQKDSLWILACLNSILFDWYFRKTSTNNHVMGYQIKQLPIPNLDDGQKTQLADWAQRLLDLHKQPDSHERQNNIAELERNINQLLYVFYDLTPEEVATIEGVAK